MDRQIQILNRNSIFFVLCLVLLIFPVTSLTLPQSTPAQLCHPARLDGEISDGTLCNITVYFSNGSKLIDFQEMDDLGDSFCYNLTSNDTAVKGLYEYELTCTAGSFGATEAFTYLVNLGGIEPSEQRTETTTRTIFIFLGLAFISFISLFFVKNFPVKVTLFLLMIWFILMGVNSAYISIQDEVLNPTIENFFSFFLVLSFWANYAIFLSIIIIWIITFIISILERRKVSLIKDYG